MLERRISDLQEEELATLTAVATLQNFDEERMAYEMNRQAERSARISMELGTLNKRKAAIFAHGADPLSPSSGTARWTESCMKPECRIYGCRCEPVSWSKRGTEGSWTMRCAPASPTYGYYSLSSSSSSTTSSPSSASEYGSSTLSQMDAHMHSPTSPYSPIEMTNSPASSSSSYSSSSTTNLNALAPASTRANAAFQWPSAPSAPVNHVQYPAYKYEPAPQHQKWQFVPAAASSISPSPIAPQPLAPTPWAHYQRATWPVPYTYAARPAYAPAAPQGSETPARTTFVAAPFPAAPCPSPRLFDAPPAVSAISPSTASQEEVSNMELPSTRRVKRNLASMSSLDVDVEERRILMGSSEVPSGSARQSPEAGDFDAEVESFLHASFGQNFVVDAERT